MPELPQISNPLEFFIFNGRAIGPQLHLILWGLGLLCIDFLIPKGKGRVGAFFAVGGIVMSSLHLYRLWGESVASAFYGMITLDSFALYFDMIFLVVAFLSVLMSYRYMEVEEELVDMVAMAVKEVKELVLEQQLVAMDLVVLEVVLEVVAMEA